MYNDAHILEKLLKDKRKELGPLPDDDDVASPKLKLSKAASHFVFQFSLSRIVLIHWDNTEFIGEYVWTDTSSMEFFLFPSSTLFYILSS